MRNEALVGEYWESWATYKCPASVCRKINWVCNGDLNDLTVSDVEALICWSCGIKFWIDEEMKSSSDLDGYHESDIAGQGEDLIDHVYSLVGKEKP